MTKRRRVGLLGGAFDPIHAGHLDLARWCAAELDLSEVRLLASRMPPHKPAPVACAHHRHAMVALATAPFRDFTADPRELARDGMTYTIDTLEALATERPGDDLVFLVGADSLRDLRTWRRPEDILRLAVVAAVARDGVDLEAAAAGVEEWRDAGRIVVLRHEPPPWSSTLLRKALREGRPPPGALPEPVADYIARNALYRAPDAPARQGSQE